MTEDKLESILYKNMNMITNDVTKSTSLIQQSTPTEN